MSHFFIYIHEYVMYGYFHCIRPPTPFPYIFPPPTGTNLQIGLVLPSYSPILKMRKRHFVCLKT
jgi:hypothetical protein